MENMEVPQIKNRSNMESCKSTSGYMPKGNENRMSSRYEI